LRVYLLQHDTADPVAHYLHFGVRLVIKKLIALLFITVASSNLFAATNTTLAQTLPWGIKSGGSVWYIANPTGTVSITFRVNQYITGHPGMQSDPVYLVCDKAYVVNPGSSVNCRMTNHVRAEFQVLPQNFKNSSEGSYTVS
jgi:hypothetical protein